MKKFIGLFFLISGFHFAKGQDVQQPDSARVFFFRPYSYAGAPNLFKVKLGDGRTIALVNNSYYELTVPAGVFEFATSRSKKLEKMQVEAGRTYYIYAYYAYSFWVPAPTLMPADSIWGSDVVRGRKLKNMKKPLVRPMSRVGIMFNGGGGFNDIPIIKTVDGRELLMGFAGGAGVSVQVGREVAKYLDIAASYSYMNRGLTPYVKNATIDFSRHFISLTPSFIIPIQGGYAQRIKIGGGIDFYVSNTLTHKTKKIPGGIDDTWKYGQVLGYHIQSMYESHVSEHFSFVWGLRYYNVTYAFKSGGFIGL